jgi:hypothetical protein
MASVHLLEGKPGRSFVDYFVDSSGAYFAPQLPSEEWARRWRRLIKCYHECGYEGAGQTIAVIDTGIITNHPVVAGALIKTIDYTVEGISDLNGHGTLVSLLALSVAPRAKLIAIKVLTRNGYCAGSSQTEREEIFASAIRRAGEEGATIINVSAGASRLKTIDGGYLDLTAVCNCPICKTAEETIARFDVAIFAAAGNSDTAFAPGGKLDYMWACPANAANVVPVIGIESSKPIARPAFADPNAVGAVGAVALAHLRPLRPANFFKRVWKRITHRSKFGSSFATPLVCGTAALIVESLASEDPPAISEIFPRNCRGPALTTGGMVDLAEFFDRPQWDDTHSDRRLLYYWLNLRQIIARLRASGRRSEAVRLDRLQLAITEVVAGPEHPSLVPILNELGLMYSEDSLLYTSALKAFERAITILEKQTEQGDDRAEDLESLSVVRGNLEILEQKHRDLLRRLWKEPLDDFA